MKMYLAVPQKRIAENGSQPCAGLCDPNNEMAKACVKGGVTRLAFKGAAVRFKK